MWLGVQRDENERPRKLKIRSQIIEEPGYILFTAPVYPDVAGEYRKHEHRFTCACDNLAHQISRSQPANLGQLSLQLRNFGAVQPMWRELILRRQVHCRLMLSL